MSKGCKDIENRKSEFMAERNKLSKLEENIDLEIYRWIEKE